MHAPRSELFDHTRSILARGQPLRLLVFGDSIANGATASIYSRSFPCLWATYLREKYGCPIHLLNFSKGGRTSKDGVELVDETARTCLPDLAVVAFGVNDQKPSVSRLARMRTVRPSVPSTEFRVNIGTIAITLQKRSGTDVVLVSPCRLPGLEGNEPYRLAMEDVASLLECGFADVAAAWPDDDESLIAEDRAHPNDDGHALYAQVLMGVGL
jgi:lysophospholipase L1-like esterase